MTRCSERRQEVTPPVARTRRARGEVSDYDDGDDDDANRVGAGAAHEAFGQGRPKNQEGRTGVNSNRVS